jgi:hypothetical protein
LVHDFTTRDRASVAKYVDINGAITEAFADLFTYYFRSEKLEINEAVTNYFLNTLKEYEGKNTDPFSLNWGAHQDAQPFICSIFFFISEKYGWDVWNRFFKVARISDLDGIPINKQGSFTDLQRYEDSLVFGDFVYILSIASGENLIPAFENWGFKFEKQIAEKINNMYKDHADYLSELANKYLEKALNKKDSEEYSQALKTLTISKCVCQNLGDIKRLEEIETLIKEIKSKNIIIDGIMDEWPPTAAMISDPSGDVSSNVTSPQGTDLKAIYALMDEKYLYIAIQMYGDFSLSLLRNYFIALDFNGDYQDEYHFGIISNDNVWVFNHTVNRNNWNTESTPGVVAIRGKDTIELRIPRNIYTIPSKILAYCRVTEGGPTVDSTAWFSIVQTKSIFSN